MGGWEAEHMSNVLPHGVADAEHTASFEAALQHGNTRHKELMAIQQKAMPWLKRSVAGLSPRRPGFALWSVHVGILVKSVTVTLFYEFFVFRCQYHSTVALHIHISSGG
jgi:hypothetical protein